MTGWQVFKLVKENGTCPIDDWMRSKDLTEKDKASIDSFVVSIENQVSDRFPPEKIKKLSNKGVSEFKIASPGKALRPLVARVDSKKQIIMLIGFAKKGGVYPKGKLESAEKLVKELQEGKHNVKGYWEQGQGNLAANEE